MEDRTKERYLRDVTQPIARAGNDDEISLVDLWLVVRRRWQWPLAGLLSGVLVAIAYSTLTTPTYESRASIQIGKVHDKGPIEEFGMLTVQLMDLYGPESEDGAQREMPYLKQVIQASKLKQGPPAPDALRLVVAAHSPEEARDFLAQIVAKLMQQHEEIYGGTIDPLRRRLAGIDGQIGLVTAQVTQLGGLISRLSESQPAQASLVAMERGRLYTELTELERERVILQRQIINPYSNPTRVIARATLPDEPVAPRKSISLAVSIVLGLMVGLFAAFFREFYAKAQAAARSDTRSI